MSKISNRKLTLEDFKDQQSWIGKLLQTMNNFFGDVFQAMNNGISIEDNLYQEIKELKFLNDSTTFPLEFKTKFNVYPKGLSVISCRDTSNADLAASPFINWSFNNGVVRISSITGLTSNKTYTMNIHVIYG